MSTKDDMVEAFLEDNPYAEAALKDVELAKGIVGADRCCEVLARSQVNATLAVAFEQRQTRFDLYSGLENHAQQTATA